MARRANYGYEKRQKELKKKKKREEKLARKHGKRTGEGGPPIEGLETVAPDAVEGDDDADAADDDEDTKTPADDVAEVER